MIRNNISITMSQSKVFPPIGAYVDFCMTIEVNVIRESIFTMF
jgi:hypothetical protein